MSWQAHIQCLLTSQLSSQYCLLKFPVKLIEAPVTHNIVCEIFVVLNIRFIARILLCQLLQVSLSG